MPLSNIWAILFFIMMLSLGVDTVMAMIEIACVAAEEYIELRRELVRFIVVFLLILLGIIIM
jgi:SNF family Na+-dependent transporter